MFFYKKVNVKTTLYKNRYLSIDKIKETQKKPNTVKN